MTDATTIDDTPTTGQKFAAEVLGTFVLVFFGVGAAVMSGGDYVATGLTFGLTVVVMAYAVGRVSGGHFNPAVTLGAVLGGRLPWSAVPLYIGAQLPAPCSPAPRSSGCCTASTASPRRATSAPTRSATGGHGLRHVGGLPARGPDDRCLHVGHPRRHRRAQRVPGRDGPTDHRPGAGDDPLRVDGRDRHVGQPGPLDRRRRLRAAPTRSSSCGCSSWRRSWVARSPVSPTR